MNMFTSYDNLPENYIPDNSSPMRQPSEDILDTKLPRRLFDLKDRFIGYEFNYGDTFVLPLTVNYIIKIDEDSLVYNVSGGRPTAGTIGTFLGQKAYNTVDAKSWTYVGATTDSYVWVEDEFVMYQVDGDRTIQLDRDMKNKSIKVDIYDFRWNHIHTFENSNSANIECEFTKELSDKIARGIYYCTIRIVTENSNENIDKFILSVI